MAYSEKYRMTFKDALGGNWACSLRLPDYSGDAYTLIGGVDPIQIVYDGDENDPYDPIRTCKATVNFYVDDNCGLLIDDLQDIDDATIFVDITSDTGQHASGFVVPDQTAKGLSLQGGEISITTQDYFVLMKGVSAYNSDGTLIYGKQNLYDYLQAQYNSALYASDMLEFNIVNPYKLISGADSTIFEQAGIAAEGFNTDNGRPDTAYNIVQKILTSFLSTSFFEGNKINIICPNGLNTASYKVVYIKDGIRTSEFLDGNNEQVSSARGAKEVSAEIQYSTDNGLLLNPFFGQWTDGLPDKWGVSQTTDTPDASTGGVPYYAVQRTGTGRPESPYGLKTWVGWDNSESSFNLGRNTNNTIYQDFDGLKGWQYSIKLNFVFTDYMRHWTDINQTDAQNTDQPPTIMPFAFLTSYDGATTYILANGDSGLVWVGGGTSGTILGFQVQSQDTEQSVTMDLPALPIPGTIRILIGSVAMNGNVFKLMDSETQRKDRTSITYTGVIVNTNVAASGETNYLTQSKNYTLKADKEDVYMQTGLTENISGALYANTSAGVFELAPKDSIFTDDFATPLSLLHQFVRAKMAMQRSARKLISFDLISNTVKFSDMIKFDDAAGVPDVFMQLTRTYDARVCKQSIGAIEINPQFIDDIDAATLTDEDANDYPNATTDLFEQYNTTS